MAEGQKSCFPPTRVAGGRRIAPRRDASGVHGVKCFVSDLSLTPAGARLLDMGKFIAFGPVHKSESACLARPS